MPHSWAKDLCETLNAKYLGEINHWVEVAAPGMLRIEDLGREG